MSREGQQYWTSRSNSGATNEFIVNPVIKKNMFYEFRNRSALGRLSAPAKGGRVYGDNARHRDIDVGSNGVIATEQITSSDEARFTLTQNMRGKPTFGDTDVETGDYLAYLHQNIYVNTYATPAVPVKEKMSAHRVKNVLNGESSEVRQQLTYYLQEEYVFEAYRGLLLGGSQNLYLPETIGGRDLDLGRGAGLQCSIEHMMIAGHDVITPPASSSKTELDAYEQRIVDGFVAADAAAAGLGSDLLRQQAYGASRSVIHDIREYIVNKKIKGVMRNGKRVWFCPTDPTLLKQLTQPGQELYEAWLQAESRSQNNPVYGYTMIELDDLIFFRDPYLAGFRPTYAGSPSEVTWGQARRKDMRGYEENVSGSWALMLILGENAILEGHDGSVETTMEKGKHGKGLEFASHVMQSFMRSRWTAKDGRTTAPLNQNSMAVAFWTPNTIFSPK